MDGSLTKTVKDTDVSASDTDAAVSASASARRYLLCVDRGLLREVSMEKRRGGDQADV